MPTERPFIVWPENWQAWELFLSVSDQWVITPSGSIIGLNGASVWPLLNSEGLGKQAYDDIRQIAHGAIRAFSEQKENRKQ